MASTTNPPPAVLYARLMSGVRIRHLQAFASIGELGSASRAAEAIGLTQPAVTHLISDLEGFLQCTLFHRHARGMQMTDIGRELLPFVMRSLAALEGGTELVAFRRIKELSIVRVGAINGAISGLLASALPAFARWRPDILVELQEANAAELSTHISNREIDLMLCREPAVCPDAWEFSELMEDRLVVVAGPEHPMASERALTLAELLDETWVQLPASTQASRLLEDYMAQHGRTPRYGKIKTRSPAMTLALLLSEHLLMLAPLSVVRQQINLGQLTALDVTDTPQLQPLGVLSPREKIGEAAAQLKAFLHRYALENP